MKARLVCIRMMEEKILEGIQSWRAKPHVLNSVGALFDHVSADRRSRKTSELHFTIHINALNVVRLCWKWPNMYCQSKDTGDGMSADTRSATEDIWIHKKTASDSSSGDKINKLAHGHGLKKRQESPSQEWSTSLLFILVLYVHTLGNGGGGCLVQIITDPTGKHELVVLPKIVRHPQSGQIEAVLFCATKYVDCSYGQGCRKQDRCAFGHLVQLYM